MDDNELWKAFQKTGRVADYLRYRGVDIYAMQNTVKKEGTSDDNQQNERSSADNRGAYYS